MKITILKELGIAIPSKEGVEELEANKLIIECYDAAGNQLKVKAKICGRTFPSGNGIPGAAIQEGTHRLTIIHEDKHYFAANMTRNGDKLAVFCHDIYEMIYAACVAAEQAVRGAQTFQARLEALEKAYNGVDLLNLI